MPDEDLIATAKKARAVATEAEQTVRDLRRMLGVAMRAEADAQRAARDAERKL